MPKNKVNTQLGVMNSQIATLESCVSSEIKDERVKEIAFNSIKMLRVSAEVIRLIVDHDLVVREQAEEDKLKQVVKEAVKESVKEEIIK